MGHSQARFTIETTPDLNKGCPMKLPSEAQLLRIFIGESDRHEGKPLYEAIVLAARERGMAGATVLRGLMGFGAHSRMHTAKILRLSEDLPLVIEIVDKPERIEAFLPLLDAMIDEGLVTLERAQVIAYRYPDAKTKDP
jgi:uncharacterized protein